MLFFSGYIQVQLFIIIVRDQNGYNAIASYQKNCKIYIANF